MRLAIVQRLTMSCKQTRLTDATLYPVRETISVIAPTASPTALLRACLPLTHALLTNIDHLATTQSSSLPMIWTRTYQLSRAQTYAEMWNATGPKIAKKGYSVPCLLTHGRQEAQLTLSLATPLPSMLLERTTRQPNLLLYPQPIGATTCSA